MKALFKISHIYKTAPCGKSINRLFLACLTLFLLVLSSPEAMAQQDFINGFYMYNPLAFNPAITGVNDEVVISGIVREQWTGLNGAPNTQYLNVHLPVFSWFDRYDQPGSIDYPTGLSSGLMLMNDKIGATQFTRASLPLAARVRLTQSGIRLSLGVRFDAARFSSNIEDLRQYGGDVYLNDPRYFVDFSTGIYAYHTKWYVGISMTNMRGIDMEEYGYKSTAHYFASAGYAHPLNDDFTLRLTTLGTLVPGTPLSVTVTPAVIIKNNIETGLTYRYDDMVGAFFSFELINDLRFGYWYEYPMGVKTNEIGSTHEVMLQLTFDRFKKRIISPRYFW